MEESDISEFPLSEFPPETHPKIEFRVNTPKLTQVVTGKNFHYFKLHLFDIQRFFKVKKSWNIAYPPGQLIYSDCPGSYALKAAIAAEHSILYSGRPWRDGNVDGKLDRNPKAFFDFLKLYRDSSSPFSVMHTASRSLFDCVTSKPKKVKDRLEIYTYVLTDDTLRFSRCGAGKSVDLSSKHALHAGAEPEVFYAGEFWVEPAANPFGQVLIIDNNSGTFAPPKADLFRMKYLIEANFPGIPLIVLDYQDPDWKLKRGKNSSTNL